MDTVLQIIQRMDIGTVIVIIAALIWYDKINKERFQKNEQKFDQKLNQLDQKFDQLDQKFDQLNQRLDRMDQKFDKIDEKITDIDRRLCRLEGAFSSKECCRLSDEKNLKQAQ